MSYSTTTSPLLTGPCSLRDRALGWVAGAVFTLFLFLGLALVERSSPAETAPVLAELRAVAMPLELPPPPKMSEPTIERPEATPLTGIEVAPSNSPVHLAVPPEDFAIIRSVDIPPKATVNLTRLHPDLRPRAEIDVDIQHVYQVSEVDQPPRATYRTVPVIPVECFGKSKKLRVAVLLVISADGLASNVRIAESSGNPQFDTLVAKTIIEEWQFSPAVRRGKRVKCLVQQPFSVMLPGGSVFELP